MDLLLGSNNIHKKKEKQSLFNEYLGNKYKILVPSDLVENPIDVIEDGQTLEENACKKAKEYFETYKIPCFADDTGLEIAALNGMPGVNSARFSGQHGNDFFNRMKVIKLLSETNTKDWSAQFRTIICFYDGKNKYLVEGICKGKIIDQERGTKGFGYDSIFIPENFEKTFAEMELYEKNSISHRYKAIMNFINLLKKIYSLD